jgi:hypothetical protein
LCRERRLCRGLALRRRWQLRNRGGGRDCDLISVHRLDQLGYTLIDDLLRLSGRLPVPEASASSRLIGDATSANRLAEVCTCALVPLDLLAAPLENRNPLARRELLAHFVLVALALDGACHVDDAHLDLGPAEHVAARPEPSLAEDERAVWRYPNGLQKPLTFDGVGEIGEVAHVLAMPLADRNVCDLHGGRSV